MKNKLKWVLIAIGFFSLSRGLWYNYQSLWLLDNGLSITTISTVTSLSALGCVSAMILLFDFITKKRLKKFICILIGLKTLTLITLFFMNGSNLFVPIKLLILLDIVLDTEILVSFYPLLTLFTKDDKLYGKKDLIKSTCYDIGILVGAIFLGKKLFNITINFNIFILLSIFFCILSFFLILKTEVKVKRIKLIDNNEVLYSLFKYLKKDKISKRYFMFVLTINISFNIVAGLKMILLTKMLDFGASAASTYLLIVSIIADILGIAILHKFTFKNNIYNILIKCGGRGIFFLLAFIIGNKYVYLLALTYTLLLSPAYGHVLDAPYINRIENNYQFAFSNMRDIVSYIGQSIGIFICGMLFNFDIKYIFLVAFIVIIINIYFGIIIYKLKTKEKHIL